MVRCSPDSRAAGELEHAGRLGSLFSGIGGLEFGLEALGLRTVWQVECEPYARNVLWQHWPVVPKYEDVCAVGAANLAPVDVICGGFPCQGISHAGRRLGLDDPRSGLWREFARIVRELRPRFVFVENVAALRVRGLGRVLGDLAEIGYDAEWDCVRAADVGAPHLRNRLFLLAYTRGLQSQGQPLAVARGVVSTVAQGDGQDGSVADTDGARLERQRRSVVSADACPRAPGPSGAAVADAERQKGLILVPLTLREANAFTSRLHRHNAPVQGHKFSIGVANRVGAIRGVSIAGRPTARHLDDGWTVEVLRVTTDGCRNACSILYAACWRAARAMGYRRCITYTLTTEPGTSLRAVGWRVVGGVKAQSWHRASRPRVDLAPLQEKLRWEVA